MYNIKSIALPQHNPTSTSTLTQPYLKCLVGEELLCLAYRLVSSLSHLLSQISHFLQNKTRGLQLLLGISWSVFFNLYEAVNFAQSSLVSQFCFLVASSQRLVATQEMQFLLLLLLHPPSVHNHLLKPDSWYNQFTFNSQRLVATQEMQFLLLLLLLLLLRPPSVQNHSLKLDSWYNSLLNHL